MGKIAWLAVPAVICLLAAEGWSQTDEAVPTSRHGADSLAESRVGGELFFQDLTTVTGDNMLLGIGWDGAHYWVTGAFDMTTAYLYELDASWNLLNSFVTGHSSWAWRDLAFDGSYLYASDSNMIDIIDRKTGTGVPAIPSPISPARALAYDPVTDTFWTASWSSSIYNVDRSGSYVSYGNLLGGIYGMGWDDRDPADPKLWIWSQDGASSCLAAEFDPLTGTFTGVTWDGNSSYGIAGGCDVYEHATFGWILLGLHQGGADGAAGYSLEKVTLSADNDKLFTDSGGTINFFLNGGAAWAHTEYVLLATSSGPGSTPLPGGNNLPLTRDLLTDFIWTHRTGFPSLIGFSGILDSTGKAGATLNRLGPLPSLLPGGTVLDFCWTTMNPWDFQSNIVSVQIVDPPSDYRYDDGSTEDLVGWIAGGDVCWMHRFDEMPGAATISSVQTIWGSAAFPGYSPANGTPAMVHVWEDPTDDGDPSDIVLLASEPVTVQNVDTDIMNIYTLSSPVSISGEFYVGAVISHSAGQYVIPVDTTTPYRWGDAFLCGTDTMGGFDPVNIMANQYPPFEWGHYWCLRAGY